MTFLGFLYYLAHLTVICTAVTESTHSTPATREAVLYGGSCLQAGLLALTIPGVALIIGVAS